MHVKTEIERLLLAFFNTAKSWHSVHGHDKNSVQCDEFCELMKEAEPLLRYKGMIE